MHKKSLHRSKRFAKRYYYLFYFRYRLNKKIQSIKIGKYPTTTLSSAREKANIFNNMLTEKIDPKEQIQKEDIKKSKTLKEVFKEWVENFYKEKSNYNT
ncbi:integrase arm-type DNA-binding domain-containing protein, partial [Campylobacter jejuni]|uniref:integrase arm-type DNA-binding domain-containing protein n=1 Tax=Campylobacter jejuni TaxID=197 RepID=UPI0033424A75